MWAWLRSLMSPRPTSPPVLRAVAAPEGDPYREAAVVPPSERTADPHTLAEVCEALEDAKVAFRPRRRGFDVVGPERSRVMPVRVLHPERVVPPEIACGEDAPELLLDLALAVVPLFGPLTADVRFAGTLVIDGTRDRAALGEEAARRIQQMGRRAATRAPITVPILLDLARRMRRVG